MLSYKVLKKIILKISLAFCSLIFLSSPSFAQGFAKILVIGNFKSGKTQMCRVLRGLEYNETLPDSAHEKCETFSIPEIDVTVNLWDTIALDLGYSRVITLAKDANVVFILQDSEKEVTEEILKNFENLYGGLKSKIAPDCELIPVCTKSDLKSGNMIRFTQNYQKLKDLFEVMGYDAAFAISSKTGGGVRQILDYLKVILPKMNLQKEIHETEPEEDAVLFERVDGLKSLTGAAPKESGGSGEKSEKKEDTAWYKKFKKMKV